MRAGWWQALAKRAYVNAFNCKNLNKVLTGLTPPQSMAKFTWGTDPHKIQQYRGMTPLSYTACSSANMLG